VKAARENKKMASLREIEMEVEENNNDTLSSGESKEEKVERYDDPGPVVIEGEEKRTGPGAAVAVDQVRKSKRVHVPPSKLLGFDYHSTELLGHKHTIPPSPPTKRTRH